MVKRLWEDEYKIGYNEIKCQGYGEVLNENSMFGRGKDDKFSVVDIYDVLKDIRNPLNLKCSILYCNDCAGKVDKVMFSVFNKGISDYHLSRLVEDTGLSEYIEENEDNGLFEDYLKVRDVLVE